MHSPASSQLRSAALAIISLAALGAAAQTAPGSTAQVTTAAIPSPGSSAAPDAASTNSIVASYGPHRVVSLREALTMTSKQGPDVALARGQAALAEAGVRRAWTAWLPDLFAQGTYDHTSAPEVFDLSALGLGVLTAVAPNSRYGQLEIDQPLFSAQGILGIQPANHRAASARQAFREQREQILLSVAQSYFALQGIEGLLKAAHDLETVALHREDEARAQIRAGTAVELQLLRAQDDTAEARVQIANLEGQRESLLPLLEALTGEAIQPQAEGSPNELPEPGALDSQPWENEYAVRAAIEEVEAVEGSIRLDEWSWLPQVQAIARESYNSNSALTLGKNFNYDLILAAKIPLYDRGARYASLHEDQARLQQAMARLAGNRAKARSNWLGARANLAASQAALAQSESQANVAIRAQAQVEASFKAGVATSLDLTDADNKRFTATSSAAQARRVVDLRKAQLIVAEGRLFSGMVGAEEQE